MAGCPLQTGPDGAFGWWAVLGLCARYVCEPPAGSPASGADFLPVSYGFRPMRRAQDAIAEIHQYGTRGYRWVLDADIEACFDSIDHVALMDRVRGRVKDKRVLGLVKAFLKAGVLTEVGRPRGHPHRDAAGRHLVPTRVCL